MTNPADTPSPLAAAAEALSPRLANLKAGDIVEFDGAPEVTVLHVDMETCTYFGRFTDRDGNVQTGKFSQLISKTWPTMRVRSGAALASDAAWRARAEAAIEVADALWGVDVAWMAYEPSDDPSAPPNASQKRHTAAVARLDAARRRYEETCRA